MKVRTFPRKGPLDFGPFCGLWASQWLTERLTFKEKLSSAVYAFRVMIGRALCWIGLHPVEYIERSAEGFGAGQWVRRCARCQAPR